MKTLLLLFILIWGQAQAATEVHKPTDRQLKDVQSCGAVSEQGQKIQIKKMGLEQAGSALVWHGSISSPEGHFVVYLSQQVSPGLTGRTLSRVYQFTSETVRDQMNFSEVNWISQDNLSVGEFVEKTVSESRIIVRHGLGKNLVPYTILCI